ncbi:hypothetical protein HZH68_001685 [Vespula germanica]|uniref:Uncharacterized protein n=1 Tax=Vespula germanica TaxID=30212 RepID=A0A834NVZ4_VESGE|nr:hypothetical protein HZH68_001685 [Vespula germanica]
MKKYEFPRSNDFEHIQGNTLVIFALSHGRPDILKIFGYAISITHYLEDNNNNSTADGRTEFPQRPSCLFFEGIHSKSPKGTLFEPTPSPGYTVTPTLELSTNSYKPPLLAPSHEVTLRQKRGEGSKEEERRRRRIEEGGANGGEGGGRDGGGFTRNSQLVFFEISRPC